MPSDAAKSRRSIAQSIQRIWNNASFVVQPRRKPLLAGRVARSYLRYATNRNPFKRPVRNIDVALTYACNLRCEHCSCELMKSDRAFMSKEDYARVAREAIDLGAIYFSFTGGEVLLKRDLEETISLFDPWRTLIGLQTNATLLTPERIDSLYAAGVDALQVSLDSGSAAEHDAFRKQAGAFDTTVQNCKHALEKGLQIIFCATLARSRLRTQATRDLLEFCRAAQCPIVVSIPCPVGKWSNDSSECFDDSDREYFASLQREYPFLRRDFESNYFRRGCSAATEKLYLTPYGDIIPCPFIHISFGNVKEEPLAIIRTRMLKLDRFREYCQVCLAGEDPAFIDAFISPTYAAKCLPMSWKDHPILSQSLR